MTIPNSFTCELKDEFKEWMDLPRFSKEYIDGVQFFLDFAFTIGEPEGEEILCPCVKCANCYWRTREVVYEHLICKGFVVGYCKWINHGEGISAKGLDDDMNVEDADDDMNVKDPDDDIDERLHDRFRNVVQERGLNEVPNEDAKKFYKLVEEANQELYSGFDQQVEREELEEMDNNAAEGTKVKKKTRGKTQCKMIHARSVEEREEIIFENRVAVGPTDKRVSDLSIFLGTIARDSKFCPLSYTNWKAIPKGYKDHIMEYVESKFIIPKEGKEWVLSRVREAWRRHKNKIKKKHFTPYDSIEDMLKNHPKDISIEVFKKLIAFWNIPTIQKISKMNIENRKRQRWSHRMGPVNFARVRKRLRLENENNEDATQLDLFIATRVGTKGKELDLETKSTIDEVQDQIKNSRENADEPFKLCLERKG